MSIVPARTNLYADKQNIEFLKGLLADYRFTVCENPLDVADSLVIRRRIYVEASGYQVPVPDDYDRRSWLLLAREAGSGLAVGSVRITPRATGSLECEEYFTLPAKLRSTRAFEISRLAILPAYRKSRTFLPIVSLGLFKLVVRFLERLDAEYMVICSKPERLWTFEWMRFNRSGLIMRYAKLGNTEHELLWYDFKRKGLILEGHPFRDFFLEIDYPEVVLPARIPTAGIPGATRVDPRRATMSA